MHVVRGVLRVGDFAVSSAGKPFQSSSDVTDVRLCFVIHAKAASPNFEGITNR